MRASLPLFSQRDFIEYYIGIPKARDRFTSLIQMPVIVDRNAAIIFL